MVLEQSMTNSNNTFSQVILPYTSCQRSKILCVYNLLYNYIIILYILIVIRSHLGLKWEEMCAAETSAGPR